MLDYWSIITGDYPVYSTLLSRPDFRFNSQYWKRLTDPEFPIVTEDEIVLWSKNDEPEDNPLLVALVAMATEMAEIYCKRSFAKQKWKQTFDWTPNQYEFELKPSQFNSIEEIASYDQNNVRTVWDASNYIVLNDDQYAPARISLNQGATFPTSLRRRSGFEVIFFTGFDTVAEVPENIKTAVKMIAQNMYETREGEMANTDSKNTVGMPEKAKRILFQYKVLDI